MSSADTRSTEYEVSNKANDTTYAISVLSSAKHADLAAKLFFQPIPGLQ